MHKILAVAEVVDPRIYGSLIEDVPLFRKCAQLCKLINVGVKPSTKDPKKAPWVCSTSTQENSSKNQLHKGKSNPLRMDSAPHLQE
jgi:hypothetical protein